MLRIFFFFFAQDMGYYYYYLVGTWKEYIQLSLGGVFYIFGLDPVVWWCCWVTRFLDNVFNGSINYWDTGIEDSSIILDLHISPFSFISFCFTYFTVSCWSLVDILITWGGSLLDFLLLFSHPVMSNSLLLQLQASLSLTISRSFSKFMFITSVMLSSHLVFWCPLLLLPSIFCSIRDFSNESFVCIRWPKYWSFSFSISPSSEYSGLIFVRLTGLIFLLPKGLSGVFPTFIVQRCQFFGVLASLPSSSHNCSWPLGRP